MTLTLPEIDIVFKQKAKTITKRSEEGIAILIIRDDTNKTFSVKRYSDILELNKDKTLYTEDNFQALTDTLTFAPYYTYAIRIDTLQEDNTTPTTIDIALKIIEKNVKYGRVTVAGGTSEDFNTLASWGKTMENKKKCYKVLTFNPSVAPDCKHVENFANEKVTFTDSRGTVTGDKYLPSMLGILASCNINRSATNFICSNLSSCEEPDDIDTAINSGKLVLMNDVDEVKVALGINSLTTTDGENITEDMKYIDYVEAMDLIVTDLRDAFKVYQNGYKNKLDNQMLYISAANDYLRTIAEDDILDINYDNYVEIDVAAQRQAWIKSGKTEAADWSDAVVKKNTFKRSMFVTGDSKILGSMDNLSLVMNLA